MAASREGRHPEDIPPHLPGHFPEIFGFFIRQFLLSKITLQHIPCSFYLFIRPELSEKDGPVYGV